MAYLKATLGDNLSKTIQEAKILVVGAGGIGTYHTHAHHARLNSTVFIGCELLKNLVLSGFEDITVVDLDTIDVSNLNRQFLFRSQHVGHSKAEVAKAVALQFNPRVKITAYHENIKSSRYSIEYFKQFSVVMNALDNVDARKHVNRICLAAQVPLVESGMYPMTHIPVHRSTTFMDDFVGTTGYLGQVSVIMKGDTECYECTEKATSKVYPICTIRSTPDKMVHCIVWAKECFKLLFGKMDDSMLWEDPANDDKSAYIDLVLAKDVPHQEYAANVFRGLFEFEILKKLDIKVYKTAQHQPSPVFLDKLDLASSSLSSNDKSRTWNDRVLWSVDECAARFVHSAAHLLASPDVGLMEFDKDHAVALEFVTAAANLRAHVFGIAMESMYACKGIAGNIIPAIATTNAIVAGLQVLEAFKILRNHHRKESIRQVCRYTYCNRSWDGRGVLLTPVALSAPNPTCFVCSRQVVDVGLNVHSTTLQQFVDHVLKKKMGVHEPTISMGSHTIYEEGDDAEESLAANLTKKLPDLPGGGVGHGAAVIVEDFSQDFTCSISIHHVEADEAVYLLGSEWLKHLDQKEASHDDEAAEGVDVKRKHADDDQGDVTLVKRTKVY
ncbi:hypothetical protein DYB31_001565 [Aphanomyces astaci]|uniref:SUMO-activating enzyme subunit n=1 Tax=Aphanomyces astaci TaxID=112090 RepID=A0A397ELX2_APHAT|nr:hypothetical protein DYB31_001565 [Aphanomyces astaci]